MSRKRKSEAVEHTVEQVSEPEQEDSEASNTDADESLEESEEGDVELRSRALPSAEDQKVVPRDQEKEESSETHSQCQENWTVVGKTGHYSLSTMNDNSVIRPYATGPQFFHQTGENQAA